MEFICKPQYVLTPDERAGIQGIAYKARNYTAKEKALINDIASRWPSQWYAGRKNRYQSIIHIATEGLFMGDRWTVDYFLTRINELSHSSDWDFLVAPLTAAAVLDDAQPTPPPLDWVNEAEKLDKLVEIAEKKIKYLLSPGGQPVQISAEAYQLVWRKGDAVYVTHSYTSSRGKVSLNGVPARTIFMILASLQKAVAGQ